MSYSDFTFSVLEEKFGVTKVINPLFKELELQEPSELLKSILADTILFSLTSEKAKSEAIIFPILAELKRKNKDKISIFSGDTLDADASQGLNGECDYVISNKPNLFDIDSPIITVIEAKRDNFAKGIPQCIAQMLGSKMFNEKKNRIVTSIYGCVTNADEWHFLRLQDTVVTIDTRKYYLDNVPEILGVFQTIVNQSI